MRKLILATAVLWGAACSSGPRPETAPVRQAGRPVEPMPIYVTPYYDSRGPSVNVGPFSEALASPDRQRVLETVRAMNARFVALPIEAMYVAAIRLYDHGARDEAVYWFYSAQYRAKLFHALVDPGARGTLGTEPFERQHAHVAFHQLAGSFINGYAACDLERWGSTLDRVAAENRKEVDLTVVYPRVRFLPRDQWASKNKEIGDGLAKLRDYLRSNREQVKATRAANGMDERFCR
jgi:hypothetical protein